MLDDPELCAEAYLQARRAAMRLRDEDGDSLPPIPARNESPAHGLLDIREWCMAPAPKPKAQSKRSPVTRLVKKGIHDNNTHNTDVILAYVNEHLNIAGYPSTTKGTVKKTISLILCGKK